MKDINNTKDLEGKDINNTKDLEGQDTWEDESDRLKYEKVRKVHIKRYAPLFNTSKNKQNTERLITEEI